MTHHVADAFGLPAGGRLLQSFDPSVVVAAPGSVRAVAAFLSVVLFGGFAVYRWGGRLDELVDESMGAPLRSVGYGFALFAVIVLLVGYVVSTLARLLVGTGLVPLLALGFGLLVLAVSGIGFAVVGAWLADAAGFRDPWIGLVAVGAVGAAAWFLLPLALGGLVWLTIAAVGVGGAARRWVHADAATPRRG